MAVIKSISSYYISVPWISPLTGATSTAYTVRLYLWDGDRDTPPLEPTYVLAKPNITNATDTNDIGISRLLNDFLAFNPTIWATTSLRNGNSQYWVKSEIVYTTSNPLDTDVPQLTETTLAIKGYGSGIQGQNPQPPVDDVLITGNNYRVSRQSQFTIPILIPDATPPVIAGIPQLTILSVSKLAGTFYRMHFQRIGNYNNLTLNIDNGVNPAYDQIIGIFSPENILVNVTGNCTFVLRGLDTVSMNIIVSPIFNQQIIP